MWQPQSGADACLATDFDLEEPEQEFCGEDRGQVVSRAPLLKADQRKGMDAVERQTKGDALERAESCGGHFRAESQTPDGEALRNDDDYCFVSAWEHMGDPSQAVLHKENLEFENVKLATRSYK